MSKLTNQVVIHIMDNLGIINLNDKSPTTDAFLIPKTLPFEDSDSKVRNAKLWGGELDISNSKMRFLFADFSESRLERDLFLVVRLDNSPAYAAYLSYDMDDYFDDLEPFDSMIAFSLTPNCWLQSNVYIQAMFLAGMEQLRDVSGTFSKISRYDDLVENLMSFIKYQDSLEDSDER